MRWWEGMARHGVLQQKDAEGEKRQQGDGKMDKGKGEGSYICWYFGERALARVRLVETCDVDPAMQAVGRRPCCAAVGVAALAV